MLEGDKTFLVNSLWERLNPSRWPLSINDFPLGSFLVGGAIRNGLLGRYQENIDLDFVVPSGAIELVQTFASKNGGTCVVLDQQRDIARWVVKKWVIDISSQIGVTLEEDLFNRDFSVNAI